MNVRIASCQYNDATDQAANGHERRHSKHRACEKCCFVPPCELAESVSRRWRTSFDRLIVQIALNVGGEGGRSLVAAIPVLLQRLHHDPVELSAEQLT